MDSSQIVIYVVIGLFVFLGILMFIMRRSRINSEWMGVVSDKNSYTMGTFNNGTVFLSALRPLTVKKNSGGNVTIYVSQGIYDEFKVGDKVAKRKGDYNPVKA